MLFILRWLKKHFWPARIRKEVIPPAVPVMSEPPPVQPAAIEPVISPITRMETTEISANRHERRRLERARRKYDKFVTPKGALPERPEKPPREAKPRTKKVEVIGPGDPFDDPRNAEYMIADSHHENRADIVAYREAEFQGEFNFRDTILQQLERYFVYLDRMKKHDPDSYGFYREIGATLLPYISTGAWNRERTSKDKDNIAKHNTPLADWFHPETERYEHDAKGRKGHDLWVPKFMYYLKYKNPPPEIQLICGGDIYKMTVWWDRTDQKRMKYGRPQEFPIFVSSDGKEVIALRFCDTRWVEIISKREKKSVARVHGHRNKGPALRRCQRGNFTIPKRAYRIPGDFEEWAKETGDNAQHFLTEMFKEAVMRAEMAQYSMTRITATNKVGTAAVFGVNIHRTSYFFQDRDIHLNAEGSRKRIFHFVRPHVRSDGSVVKAHFRGEKEFDWAGYHIKITIPGKDHFMLGEFDVGSSDEYWRDPKDKSVWLHQPELGKKLKGWMDQGLGKIS